jgi:hypothetical protein
MRSARRFKSASGGCSSFTTARPEPRGEWESRSAAAPWRFGPSIQHLAAQFDVAIGTRSFTAILDGDFNSVTRRTLLNGTITGGWLQGAQVHEQGQLVNTDTGHFVGELRLTHASAG